MRNKWPVKAIEKLVKEAERYNGTIGEYIKSINMSGSQYYKLRSKLQNTQIPPAHSNKIVQILPSLAAKPQVELQLPNGKKVCVFNQDIETAVSILMKYAG